MYRGRYLLGEYVPLLLYCRNGSGTPSVPDNAPLMRVYSSSGLVLDGTVPLSRKMAIEDRYVLDGVFKDKLHLGSLFSTGPYRVVYTYAVSGTAYGDEDRFEVKAGGHSDGAGISMFHYPNPRNDSVLVQCESGRLIRRRNPRLD